MAHGAKRLPVPFAEADGHAGSLHQCAYHAARPLASPPCHKHQAQADEGQTLRAKRKRMRGTRRQTPSASGYLSPLLRRMVTLDLCTNARTMQPAPRLPTLPQTPSASG